MYGELNLQILLQEMSPVLKPEAYVFLTSPDGFSEEEEQSAVMTFREEEGLTIIVPAEASRDQEKDKWAMITLNVHSDLNAVGFLAAISGKLAEAKISVNPVSAFYHDHLFVPWDKKDLAMEILKSFQV